MSDSNSTVALERIAFLESVLREALQFLQNVGTEEDDDLEATAYIERLSGRITGALGETPQLSPLWIAARRTIQEWQALRGLQRTNAGSDFQIAMHELSKEVNSSNPNQ